MNIRDLFKRRSVREEKAQAYEATRPRAPLSKFEHYSTLHILGFREINGYAYVDIAATVLRGGQSIKYSWSVRPGDVLRFYGDLEETV